VFEEISETDATTPAKNWFKTGVIPRQDNFLDYPRKNEPGGK